jgi:hypothetical protein
MPFFLPEELLTCTVEMVCYFLTAVGGLVGLLFMPRG